MEVDRLIAVPTWTKDWGRWRPSESSVQVGRRRSYSLRRLVGSGVGVGEGQKHDSGSFVGRRAALPCFGTSVRCTKALRDPCVQLLRQYQFSDVAASNVLAVAASVSPSGR